MNETPTPKSAIRDRLARLRAQMAKDGLTGSIIPHADEYQSEYLPASAERLAWLTGFDGSAGMAVVLKDKAALFVDGRYTLQAKNQTDTEAFAQENLIENPPSKWLAKEAKAGDRIGYDPWLLTVAEVKRFAEACAGAEVELVAVERNPLDAVWEDRPAAPLGQVTMQPVSLAGEEAATKIAELQKALAEKKVDAAIIAATESIAWMLNIRGSDTGYNPVPLSFLVLPAKGKPVIHIDGRKLSNTVRTELSELAEVEAPGSLLPSLAALGAAKARVLVDPSTTADAIGKALRDAGGVIVEGSDPAVLPKAKKNATELAGTRKAHIRDGAALVKFLRWLDDEAPKGAIDEMGAADRLREIRADNAKRDGSELADLSFPTISGTGPNGAIIHYRSRPSTNRKLEMGSLYLIDSGAQYRDGTTDVTRTIAIGQPSAEMRDRFTRVLKGHIGIATVRFPRGTSGAQIDALARLSLWQAGLDYDHGTGHGVGTFLSVHEGPARISKLGTVPMEPGMILSNEPGYYKPGAFGIRIENLVVVTPPAAVEGGERDMMAFETITLAPIDRTLIDVALLTPEERRWIDAYHARLLPALSNQLNESERAWLAEKTRPLD